ncbi:NB-ARC domain-containing protein [Streptomyces boninensis]|uniref:NB-ARC domain-containing protein n=1 Tax=Streptomyces boninensis TaxID=2039455 RepID=UPI003B20D31D
MTEETGGGVRNEISGDAHIIGNVFQAGYIGQVIHQHPPPPVPRQLPPEQSALVDRAAELAALLAARDAAAGTQRPAVLVLSGPSGIGKTALAHRLGHRLEQEYPDGTLHENLGFLHGGARPAVSDALGRMIAALTGETSVRAGTPAARAGQYRTLTHGKRLIVVLDDVDQAATVEQLLPASAASLVIVTSHFRLPELADRGGGHHVPLDPLADAHAAELLGALAGPGRLAADPAALTELSRYCAGLPMALRVAGTRLRSRQRLTVARLVRTLNAEGVPVVEAVWDAAYRELPPPAAELYRLLSLHPARQVSAAAATALLGRGPDAGDDALDDLVRAGLLLTTPEPDRYALHDLLRRHADRRARADGAEGEARAGCERLVRWYRRQAERADRCAEGASRLRLAEAVGRLEYAPDVEFAEFAASGESVEAGESVESVESADKAGARAWLRTERAALHGCVRLAHESGLVGEAWALCEPLWVAYMSERDHAAAQTAFGIGVKDAERAEHLPAQVRMRSQLARPLWELGRLDEADELMRRAVAAARTSGHARLTASALEFRGKVLLARGEAATAGELFAESLRVNEELGNAYGVLLQRHHLGQVALAQEDMDRAAGLLEQAHAAARRLGKDRMAGRTAAELGRVRQRQGHAEEAGRLYGLALEISGGRGDAADEALVLRRLAGLARESGAEEAAAEYEGAAREIYGRAGLSGEG